MIGRLQTVALAVRRRVHDDGEEAPGTADIAVELDGAGRPPLDDVAATSEVTVERLLAAADGRLRQQAIVAATPWSAATVSRRLSEMEADGRISRVTKGREKMVYLPAAGPDTNRDARGDELTHS